MSADKYNIKPIRDPRNIRSKTTLRRVGGSRVLENIYDGCMALWTAKGGPIKKLNTWMVFHHTRFYEIILEEKGVEVEAMIVNSPDKINVEFFAKNRLGEPRKGRAMTVRPLVVNDSLDRLSKEQYAYIVCLTSLSDGKAYRFYPGTAKEFVNFVVEENGKKRGAFKLKCPKTAPQP